MLSIDRLLLRLPAGFEARAGRLARMAGEELAALDSLTPQGGGTKLSLSRLEVAPVRIELGRATSAADDRELAAAIAGAIHDGVRKQLPTMPPVGGDES